MFSILIVVLITLLLTLLSIWLYGKAWVQFVDTVIDRVSSLINSKLESVTGQSEAGPWYLAVYTKDSNYPIWISNNNIRSVHPDPEHCKIIVKQFNGEDMVIENASSYEMFAANDLIGCGMKIDITHTI